MCCAWLAESVHVSEEGTLWLPDRYGNVFNAEPNSTGGYSDMRKVAYIGPSRPLGHTMDADGHLLVADSAKVQPCTHAAVPCTIRLWEGWGGGVLQARSQFTVVLECIYCCRYAAARCT